VPWGNILSHQAIFLLSGQILSVSDSGLSKHDIADAGRFSIYKGGKSLLLNMSFCEQDTRNQRESNAHYLPHAQFFVQKRDAQDDGN